MSKNLVGIDIGGTKVLIVLLDENKVLKKRIVFPMSNTEPKKILDEIISNVKKLENISTVGVSIAGDIDSKNGILRFSPNLPKWKNVRLKKYFEEQLKVPTVVDNDANCAAYGSYIIDGQEKYKNFITVTLGTGIGGGIIIDGNLYRGSTGTAGEIGHITISPDGPKCNCENRGCLEAHIGTKGILEMAAKSGISNKNITVKIIAHMAREGDKRALKVYEKFAEYLAVGVGSLINIFNPDMITFSGGVSNNWDLVKKRFFSELKKRTFKTSFEYVKIIKSKSHEDLGAIGAALLPKMNCNPKK
ncbi:MAG: ROK family protein [Elusimicrobiota bacterium]